MVRRAIGAAWGQDESWADVAFSYGVVDSVAIAKPGGEWKMANWRWTAETEHCRNATNQE
jgi:hypothetical protein